MSCTGQTLAIDAGGVKGLIPALICADIEKKKGARIAKIFDVAVGSSTGSLLVAGFFSGKFSASELVDAYRGMAPKIFHETLVQEAISGDGYYSSKYSPNGLEEVLKEFTGDMKMKDLKKQVLFTTVRVSYDLKKAELCHISKDPEWEELLLRDALRYTTAAPSFFPAATATFNNEPVYYLDGGLMESNPTFTATLACAHTMHCGANQIVVSLGTGQQPPFLSRASVTHGGAFSWIRPAIDILFEGQSATVEHYTKGYLGDDDKYFRAQMSVLGHDEMDNATEENLNALTQIGEGWVSDHENELINLCDQLKVREDDIYSI